MTDSHSIGLRNDLAELHQLADAIAQFGARNDLPAKRVGDLQLVMEELVVNAITHGFPQGGQHTIHIELRFEDECISARITDDGIPFNPLQAKPPDTTQSVADRPIGGLGIHLVKMISDKLDHRREGNTNILQVQIRL